MRTFLLFLLLGWQVISKAQLGKEAWHWQFGYGLALDFSSGTPVLGSSAIAAFEGCASISDENSGQLLFYTNGMAVWDRNNQVMPNGAGLLSSATSTQAATIFKKPGSTHLYYVITVEPVEGSSSNKGVHYSVVDMSLNGGLGDVTTMNTLLTPPPVTEKVTAAKHCNGRDIWVVTHTFNSNNFNAYLFTPWGISSAVVSSIGTIQYDLNGSGYGSEGAMKISPNGKKIAVACEPGYFELFDFDNSTGKVSNHIKLTNPVYNYLAYGVAFSPDNTKLYASNLNNSIFQYDISSGVDSIINSTAMNVAGGVSVQLGPDGKIYTLPVNGDHVGVINNPNNKGLACNANYQAIQLPSWKDYTDLPNFVDANFNANGTYPNSISYLWNDGSLNPIKQIATGGIYWLEYFLDNGCVSRDSFNYAIRQAPFVNIGADTSFCYGTKKLDGYYPNSSYLWSNGTTAASIVVHQPGLYWVRVAKNGCVSTDTIRIQPNLDLPDTYVPNVVTPNGDLINDYTGFGKLGVTNIRLEIFDRWGRRVFLSEEAQPVWWAEDVTDGTYFYVEQVRVECGPETNSKLLKGFITVIR